MSELVAVAALDERHVAWLGALLGHVALLATVTASASHVTPKRVSVKFIVEFPLLMR